MKERARRRWRFWIVIVPLISQAALFVLVDQSSGRKQLDADEHALSEIRTAIRLYQHQNGRLPHDKAAVETVMSRPPTWRCDGQEWIYQQESGSARLRVTDPLTCMGRRRGVFPSRFGAMQVSRQS